MFKKQLKIKSEIDFNFQAVSILINDDLYPHTDSLNPSNFERDYTIVLTSIIKTTYISEPMRSRIEDIYPDIFPICVVIYNRNCVLGYSKHVNDISNFMLDNNNEIIVWSANGKV